MRRLLLFMHRWCGLVIAPFLIVTGLTGAVISWDHELDEALNPHLLLARDAGTPRPTLDLVGEVEAREPRLRVVYFPLAAESGKSLSFGIEPRRGPVSGKPFSLGFNQIFVDPASGRELGRREWGAVGPVSRETFVSFLYKLHFTLQIPELFGEDRWGIWLLGGIAALWFVDCFSGFALTLPASRRERWVPAPRLATPHKSWWQRWSVAWKIKWPAGPYRLNYDLHRAASLWTWGVLLVLAFTAFSLNLYREVFFPLMSMVSPVTPTPFDRPLPATGLGAIEPNVGASQIVELARGEATRRNWGEPPGSVYYSSVFNVYSVQFFRPGNDHGSGGVGPARLFYSGNDGTVLGQRLPWTGTAADLFVQAQFPLHSGRILGLFGRILISLMGVLVAMLAVSGMLIWMKKTRRLSLGAREAAAVRRSR